MKNVFTDYPDIPWKPGWRLSAGPADRMPFITGSFCGTLTVPGADWILQLTEPSAPVTTRFLSSGLSLRTGKKPGKNWIHLVVTAPGVLCGTVSGLPLPTLTSENGAIEKNEAVWVTNDHSIALLLCRTNRFALVCGMLTPDRAFDHAETALKQNFELLEQIQTDQRAPISRLFSINSRHNAPVALAAESLKTRLRERTGPFHGLWSTAEGFPTETFSLNELYPLVRAWNLIDPPTALELVQTALGLQQNGGGFPAWVDPGGATSPAASRPFIAQSFELAWRNRRDQALLKKTLPALRKYAQWAVRRFDPHRDRIPAWQNEEEVFIPGSFERGKATPELTVLLIAELEAILRLCDESEHPEPAAESLKEEHAQLIHTLYSVFWDPEQKAFSNVWKDGHYLHEPSFGSFLPLFWRGLDKEKRAALINSFEEIHGFPGHAESVGLKREQTDDTVHLPVAYQFMLLETLRQTDEARPLLMLFIHRARENFAVWFEHESIEAARRTGSGETTDQPAYALGTVTAAFILAVQDEFQREAAHAPSTARLLLKWARRLRIGRADLLIIAALLFALLVVHVVYHPPENRNADDRLAEAALDYQQGRFKETLAICRRYPDHPLSRFLYANMLLLTEQPAPAAELYRQILLENAGSPSALFGLALALQMDGQFDQAVKRYRDFIDIYQDRLPDAAARAEEFLQFSNEQFRNPPHWKSVLALPMMNDLGL
ncbi:MAG: hypothetical protein PWQ29_1112 [Verrucomicrobiota bacterium]|jgi:tetratricopeptide (TPR) repeat protein|nr:hypothetical protein [Verrucomicrobiota bacterium]